MLLALTAITGLLAVTTPPDLVTVIDNVRDWLTGLLAALATVFLIWGGVRYMTAGGNPAALEQAKEAIRSAAIGYAMAALAPLAVTIIKRVVGVG
jgi:hypothetical protein